jgi:hypothetical protein
MTQRHLDRALRWVFIVWMALFLWMLFGLVRRVWSPFAGKRADKTLSDECLDQWYKDANEEYFANRLPKRVTIHWGDLTQTESMGTVIHYTNGTWAITIDRTTNQTQGEALLTGYHEMCHMVAKDFGLDTHGPKFQSCMVHLAEAGAFKELW